MATKATSDSRPCRAVPLRLFPLVHWGNAKYWFRRVGRHPVFEAVRAAAAESAAAEPHPSTSFLTTQREWDPFAFIDLCAEILAGRSPCEMFCRKVQQREWEALFDHCYRQAIDRRE